MSSPHSDIHTNNDQLVGANERPSLEQARGCYADGHSDVSVIIVHMSELLSSFVREDKPEKRAEWTHALAELRNGIDAVNAHEELRSIADFSIMLEHGLQSMADKCAKSKMMPAQFVACDLCPDVVPRLRYANHLKHVHPEEFEKVAKFACSYCRTARFIKEPALKAHLEVCRIRLEHLSFKRRLDIHPQNLFCRMCNVKCATLVELAQHAQKKHPHCQILTCTGCARKFRWPNSIVAHWKEIEEKFPLARCRHAYAVLLTRAQLVGQLLARAKSIGTDKSCTSIECLAQDIACQKCGLIVGGFLKLYHHVHGKHNKDVQSSLLFCCIGCKTEYKSPPGLRDHLLKSEIEGYEMCRNGGVAYWDGVLISTDMRPAEKRRMDVVVKEEVTESGDYGTSEDRAKDGVKEEEDTVMRDYGSSEDQAKNEEEKEEDTVAGEYGTSEDRANGADKKKEGTVSGFGSSEDQAKDEEKKQEDSVNGGFSGSEDGKKEGQETNGDTVMGAYGGLDEEKGGDEEDTVFEDYDTTHDKYEEKKEVRVEEVEADLEIKRTSIPDQSMEVDA